jgi:hypothetical protein
MDDKLQLQHTEDGPIWVMFDELSHREVIVAGSQYAPDAERVTVAKQVLRNIETLEKQAVDYLNYFVSPNIIRTAHWRLDGLDFGHTWISDSDEFIAWFLLKAETWQLSDESGRWFVKFGAHGRAPFKVVPIAFGRIQY